MNIRTIIYFFIYTILAISCNESVIESETLTQKTNELKAATIGTTYYVAKTGNDNNSGTSASPFLTIQKATTVLKAGDTVILKDGIYTATADYFLNLSGAKATALNPVVFKSEHQWGAKLDGQNNKTTTGISISYSSYITFQDFEIYGFSGGGIKISSTCDHITLKGNKIHDIARMCTDDQYGKTAIHVTNSTDVTIEKNIIYTIGRFANGENGCTNGNSYWQNHDHGIYICEDVDRLTISNNIFYDCKAGWAIHVYNGTGSLNSNISILNNTFANPNPNRVGQIVLYTPMINFKIENNIFHSPLTAAVSLVDGMSYTNCEIKNNITYNGVISSGPISGITISNNMNNTNPLLVSTSTNNFNLQASSPAINAGIAVGLTSDYFGNSIIGMPDIGAIELTASSPISTTYYNTQASVVAVKNDCGAGYTSSTVTYIIAANKYSSTVSQADADSKASADLNTNKQAYANANGTCTAIPVYYNSAISGTATKSDCGTGYSGSIVTYTVAAKKYSSIVSQADADSKATNDLSANKQTYANANGTCTVIVTTVYYNTAKSATATKNDCGTGYTGSTVTGTVPAKYFSSTISQTDADNKAIAMAKDGIQAYANAHGTCTPKKK